jgi:hypothetical protein
VRAGVAVRAHERAGSWQEVGRDTRRCARYGEVFVKEGVYSNCDTLLSQRTKHLVVPLSKALLVRNPLRRGVNVKDVAVAALRRACWT